MKVCKKCGEQKERLAFYRQTGGDGYKPTCKKCCMKYQEAYRNRKVATPDPELTRLLNAWTRSE